LVDVKEDGGPVAGADGWEAIERMQSVIIGPTFASPSKLDLKCHDKPVASEDDRETI